MDSETQKIVQDSYSRDFDYNQYIDYSRRYRSEPIKYSEYIDYCIQWNNKLEEDIG